jgi:hypothetical protein
MANQDQLPPIYTSLSLLLGWIVVVVINQMPACLPACRPWQIIFQPRQTQQQQPPPLTTTMPLWSKVNNIEL